MNALTTLERFRDLAQAVRVHLSGDRCPEDGELLVMEADVRRGLDDFERWLEVVATEEAIGRGADEEERP